MPVNCLTYDFCDYSDGYDKIQGYTIIKIILIKQIIVQTKPTS